MKHRISFGLLFKKINDTYNRIVDLGKDSVLNILPLSESLFLGMSQQIWVGHLLFSPTKVSLAGILVT